MRRSIRLGVTLASLGVVMAASAAPAATRVVIETRKVGETAGEREPERTEVWAEPARMRVDVAGGKHSIVYSVEQGIVWALDHERKSVLELDRSTASGVASRLAGVESELRARTSELPAEAQAAAEQLLDSTFGPESAPPARTLAIRDSGEVGRVRGIACRIRDLWVEGERSARFCEATLADAEVPPAAMLPLRSLAEFARDVSPLIPDRVRADGLAALDLFDRVEGVPLAVDLYEGEAVVSEAIVSEVSEGEAPADAFAIPADYRNDIAIRVRERLGGP